MSNQVEVKSMSNQIKIETLKQTEMNQIKVNSASIVAETNNVVALENDAATSDKTNLDKRSDLSYDMLSDWSNDVRSETCSVGSFETLDFDGDNTSSNVTANKKESAKAPRKYTYTETLQEVSKWFDNEIIDMEKAGIYISRFPGLRVLEMDTPLDIESVREHFNKWCVDTFGEKLSGTVFDNEIMKRGKKTNRTRYTRRYDSDDYDEDDYY